MDMVVVLVVVLAVLLRVLLRLRHCSVVAAASAQNPLETGVETLSAKAYNTFADKSVV